MPPPANPPDIEHTHLHQQCQHIEAVCTTDRLTFESCLTPKNKTLTINRLWYRVEYSRCRYIVVALAHNSYLNEPGAHRVHLKPPDPSTLRCTDSLPGPQSIHAVAPDGTSEYMGGIQFQQAVDSETFEKEPIRQASHFTWTITKSRRNGKRQNYRIVNVFFTLLQNIKPSSVR